MKNPLRLLFRYPMQFLFCGVQWCIHIFSLAIVIHIRDPYLLRFRQIAVWLLMLWGLAGVGIIFIYYRHFIHNNKLSGY